MFRIKICGITNVDDAECVVRSSADAIGLNFYPKSSRFIDDQTAREIAAAVDRRVKLIGVFVNESADRIEDLARNVPLDGIQLHGDETVEFTSELRNRLNDIGIIRAFRCRDSDFQPVLEFLYELSELNTSVEAILLDAFDPNHYGGTGKQLDFEAICEQTSQTTVLPYWILAGGLNSQNVADAIRSAKPGGVDTASGVEASPGVKDPDQVAAFANQATQAFEASKS